MSEKNWTGGEGERGEFEGEGEGVLHWVWGDGRPWLLLILFGRLTPGKERTFFFLPQNSRKKRDRKTHTGRHLYTNILTVCVNFTQACTIKQFCETGPIRRNSLRSWHRCAF